MHCGVDYGAKRAGTTVIAYENEWGRLCLQQSSKNKDADQFCLGQIENLQPEVVFIDAPLSLPEIYGRKQSLSEHGKHDYFFRKCDRELSAMSPMFLGGLTARAMYFKSLLEAEKKIKVIETYPAALAKELKLVDKGYDKKRSTVGEFLPFLQRELPLKAEQVPTNWHQVDAILAWFSGWRFFKARAKSYGDPKEGVIWI